MHFFSIGDNLHEMSNSVFWENKKNISICRLLKFLRNLLPQEGYLSVPCKVVPTLNIYLIYLSTETINFITINQMVKWLNLDFSEYKKCFDGPLKLFLQPCIKVKFGSQIKQGKTARDGAHL